jgi:protein O-GlcNAc transferase
MRKSVNLTQTSSGKGPAGRPRHRADAETTRLMRLVESQRYADVERVAREYLARNGRHALALKALSFALVGLSRFEEAIPVVDFALRDQPEDGELHNNRAIALAETMRWEDAIAEFGLALSRLPNDAEIHKNLGTALFRINRWNEAVPPLLKAIELHPGEYLEAIEVLAKCLYYARRMDEAFAVCNAMHEAYPDNPYPLHRLTEVELHRCSWAEVSRNIERLKPMIDSPSWSANPWGLFKYWGVGMAEFRRMAERFARLMVPQSVRDHSQALPLQWRAGQRPLHVAYMSADFGEHPVANVIAELIERHDRASVRVTAYALNKDDGSEQRKRLESAFDLFSAVDRLSVREIAARIRADGVDVLVDLNGWTGSARAEVLALRAAPIQVSWLGYAGTIGWPLLADHVIGDPIVIPAEHEAFYTERILRMPHCYMPVDTRHPIGPLPKREDLGLPRDGFVLCSFNNSYKLNPPCFDLWCRILRQMPDAVLWMSQGNDTVKDNLRREAEQRGVAGARLIFATRAPDRAEYLARIGVADLALDPFPYNSHSTGVDALIAGVPLVTKLGDTFPSRVGASLVTAAGLPELAASDEAGYEALVLGLHADRARLVDLRRRLAQARHSAPLFDMEGFARDLEALYVGMVETMVMSSPHDVPDRRVPATGT